MRCAASSISTMILGSRPTKSTKFGPNRTLPDKFQNHQADDCAMLTTSNLLPIQTPQGVAQVSFAIDFATSWALSMKSFAAGLSVRFFNVKI